MKKIIIFSLLVLTLLLSVFIVEESKAQVIQPYESPYLDVPFDGITDVMSFTKDTQSLDDLLYNLDWDSSNKACIITPYIMNVQMDLFGNGQYFDTYFLYDVILFETDTNRTYLDINLGVMGMETLFTTEAVRFHDQGIYPGMQISIRSNNNNVEYQFIQEQEIYSYDGVWFANKDFNRIIFDINNFIPQARKDTLYLNELFQENNYAHVESAMINYIEMFQRSESYNQLYINYQNLVQTATQQQQQIQSLQEVSSTNYLENLWDGMSDLLNVKILPGFTIGTFLFVPLLILMLGIILKVARG